MGLGGGPYNHRVEIIVNGKPETLPADTTVAALLVHRGLSASPCAVEVNKIVVPKRRHDETQLKEHDKVEIVTLVGGG